jgi:hypothetical protein
MTDTTAVTEPVTATEEDVQEVTPDTFESELDALLRALPERTIGEYLKTADVQDTLLDVRNLAKKYALVPESVPAN